MGNALPLRLHRGPGHSLSMRCARRDSDSGASSSGARSWQDVGAATGAQFAVNFCTNVAPKKQERRPKKKTPKETPAERATREYYEGANPEAIAEENALAAAFAQSVGEWDVDEEY